MTEIRLWFQLENKIDTWFMIKSDVNIKTGKGTITISSVAEENRRESGYKL